MDIGLAVKRAGGQIYGRCRVVGHNRSKIVKNFGAWLRRSGIPDSVHVAHPDGGTSGLAGGTGGVRMALTPKGCLTRCMVYSYSPVIGVPAPRPPFHDPRDFHVTTGSLHTSRGCLATRTSTSSGSLGYGTTHLGRRSHRGTAPVEGSGNSCGMVPVVWDTPTPAAIMGGGCGGRGTDASPTMMAMLESDGATCHPCPGRPAGPTA